jgi:SAM-dependent methyltransferase
MTEASAYAALATDDGLALVSSLEAFDESRAAAAARYARKLVSSDVARAAMATAFARRRARASAKFEQPELMLFTRTGYEQASSEAVARHRSIRFAGLGVVADLCCGIGSDAIAIARRGCRVLGYDIERETLECAAHNARALGVGASAHFSQANALEVSLAGVDAAFADPSRRAAGVRLRGSDAYAPPLALLLARAGELGNGKLCVKAAPGLDYDAPSIRATLRGLPLEVELVSEHDTCKETVLWCGGFAASDGARRATVIDRDGIHSLTGIPSLAVEVRPLAAYVGEPDPAIVRAELIAAACEKSDAAPLDPRVAYVTAESPATGPFIRWYRVLDAMPFGVKRLRAYLREHEIGNLVVKTRAFPIRPDEIVALLKPRGVGHAVLVCTTIGARKTAIVCSPQSLK